jgi:hypothetical protein
MFGPSNPDTDDPELVTNLPNRVKGDVPSLGSVVTDEVGYQEDLDLGDLSKTHSNGFGNPMRLQAPPTVVSGGVKRLGIEDVLGGQIPRNLSSDRGEVFVLAKVLVLPDPSVQEMVEIAIAKLGGERVDGWHFRIPAVFLDELPKAR